MITSQTLKLWVSMSAQLSSLKKQEMNLRKDIQKAMGIKTGIVKQMFDDVEATIAVSEQLSVKREDLLSLTEGLTNEERAAIIWKPSIDKRVYDSLPMDSGLRRIVTLKLGTPKLSVIGAEVI